METLLDRVRASMRGLVPATEYDKVYNDECVLSFDSPFSPGGLYVSLRTYLGFGAQHVGVEAAGGRAGAREREQHVVHGHR